MEAFGMKKSMEDLFYQYRVNAAFSGHVHAYERFLPMYNNVTNTNATIYMTVGTGGQNYGTLTFSLFSTSKIAFRTLVFFSFTKPLMISSTVDGNKFVGVSPASKNETYSSVYTHTGIIYGYGTLTINSASVATWNMFKNSMTVSPGQTAIDTVLICNSYTTGSAICPYTTIPSAGPTSVFIFAQVTYILLIHSSCIAHPNSQLLTSFLL